MDLRPAKTDECGERARAVEVMARGRAFMRSVSHPCECDAPMPGLWWLRDGLRASGDQRRDEWVAWAVTAEEVDRWARKRSSSGKFAVAAIRPAGETPARWRDPYRVLSYRLGFTQPLMVRPLTAVVPLLAGGLARTARADDAGMLAARGGRVRIERVLTRTAADAVARVAGGARPIRPEHLTTEAPLRLYAAWVEEEVVGWVRSYVRGESAWCSRLEVTAPHRRRGIASGLMARMLADDQVAGARESVLLASHAGAKLYPGLGYQTVGALHLFTPGRDNGGRQPPG